MYALIQDLRFSCRMLWRDRGFSLTVLLTVSLCIAGNAAVFSIVDSVLLRPLPFPEPGRVLLLYNSYPGAGVQRSNTAVPDYFDRRRETTVFEEQAVFSTRGLTIGGEARPERVSGLAVTPTFFRVLGVELQLGREFSREEGELGNDHRVILSHACWERLFAGDPGVLGRELRINAVPHTVVGVLSPEFQFVPDAELLIPLAFAPEQKLDEARHNNSVTMIARLRPEATVAQAQAQVDAINERNLERFPGSREILTNARFHTVVVPFQDDLVREVRGTLYLLWGAVAFVLLIGCANVTNLVLVRSSARRQELATRTALGAPWWRLGQQILTETLVLTVAGGVAGLVLGRWVLSLLTGSGLEHVPRGHEVAMDLTAVAYTLALSAAVGVAVSLLPILSASRVDLATVLREEGWGGTSGRPARLLRRGLASLQVGVALVLLAGAGLLLESFRRVLDVDPGFEPRGVLTGYVNPPAARYPGDGELRDLRDRLLARVRSLPGVRAAGVTDTVPFSGDADDSVILAEGYRMSPGESLISPDHVVVGTNYFETMAVSLVRGRFFDERDTLASPDVIIVDERLANLFWAGQDPLGRRMYHPQSAENAFDPGPNPRWLTVVGVIRPMKLRGLARVEHDNVGAYFRPYAQHGTRRMAFAIRTDGDPASLAPAVSREIAAVDPQLPFFGVRTMEERLDASLVTRRTALLLALGFAVVALLLAAVGIYGVLAYQVLLRTREIGIRMALGSESGGIFRLILREGAALLVGGLILGLAGAFAIRRVLESQLFGVGATDPFVLGLVVTVLALVTLLACSLPARRAARVDPVIALGG